MSIEGAERGGMDGNGCRVALVLGGGNALGAYQAGVYEALHDRRLHPHWVVGTSIGAVNGAIIAGNPIDRRLERLRELWRPAEGKIARLDTVAETWRRTASVLQTAVSGRRGMFAPQHPFASWWPGDASAGAPALYDTGPLEETLARLIDFDLLRSGSPRFSVVTVDLETGAEVVFDTSRDPVDARHIRASAALLAAFPAVEIGDRLLVDGGFSANLPLDPVLSAPAATPTLCIAADLLPLAQARPTTPGEVISRFQDLTFAAQSRRTIERWRDHYADAGRSADDTRSITLVRLAYNDQGREVAGKAMDFSPESVRHRWSAGWNDAVTLLDRLDQGDIPVGIPGLTVIDG